MENSWLLEVDIWLYILVLIQRKREQDLYHVILTTIKTGEHSRISIKARKATSKHENFEFSQTLMIICRSQLLSSCPSLRNNQTTDCLTGWFPDWKKEETLQPVFIYKMKLSLASPQSFNSLSRFITWQNNSMAFSSEKSPIITRASLSCNIQNKARRKQIKI